MVWLSDGLTGRESEEEILDFAGELQRLGRLDVIADRPEEQARLLLPPQSEGLALTICVSCAARPGRRRA